MTEQEVGIQETKELLAGLKTLAVKGYLAKRIGGDVQAILTRLVTLMMADPKAAQTVVNAFDNVPKVLAEVQDLTLLEGFQVIAEAGKLAAEGATEIQAA